MDTYYQGLIWTKHAISRLYNRGISQADAWYTFIHSDGKEPGKTPGSIKYYKNYGPQRIEIVAKKNEKDQWIILSVWSKYPGKTKQNYDREDNFLEKLIKKGLNKLATFFGASKY